MKYLYISLLVIFIFFGFAHQQAKANDYGTATTAHIISEMIKGTDLNEKEILNAETQRQIHNMSLEIINVMFKSLPNILDSISAQLRQEADKKYKCSLQSKDYKNEECND
jgi:hypothetical protein